MCFLFLLPLQANAFFYKQEDKNLHLATSMALTYTISSGLMLTNPKMSSRKAALIAATSVLLIGLAKESFYDDKFDWKDMEANTVGVALGAVPFLIWEF
jgi:hypothetical protein